MSRLTLAIIFLLIAGAAFFFGVASEWEKVRSLRREIAGLIRINDELQEIAATRERLTNEYNSIPRGNFAKLSEILPPRLATAQYLGDIETLAARHGVFLKSIDFVKETKPVTGQIRLPVGRFSNAVNVSLSLRGSYESFRALLRDLEKLVRITDVSEISFGAQAVAAQQSPLLEYSLKGSIYYAK